MPSAVKPRAVAGLAQRRDVAGRAVAEAEVRADHDGARRAAPSTSTRSTNSSGDQRGDVAVERQREHGVGAGVPEQLGAAPRAR